MTQVKNICSRCERPIDDEDEFCPDCGTLFKDNVKCSEHTGADAEGVCVICCEPYCKDCGLFVNDRVFLCSEHSDYEIFEDMARVYGSVDSLQVDYAKSCLEQEGLNPMIYSRRSNSIHMGASDYLLFEASGDYIGHLVNETKLLVPVQQVMKAEEILRELEIIN